MDALTTLQYRFLLAALGIAVVAGGVAFALISRGGETDRAELADAVAPGAGWLVHLMLLLVALAVATGVVLALPAVMILPYFPHWRVAAMLILALLILAAPVAYAWRARPR